MKIKKIISILVICAVLAVPFSVSAAVLEVDTGSPMFKADTWQNNEGNDEVCPLIKAFEPGPTRPTGGVANSEISRYSGCVNVNQDQLEGAQVFINGSATNSVIFPFTETVVLDKINLKWNNGTRQYFFFAYTSTDGQNWTEINFTGDNIRRGTCAVTYDDYGDLAGPAVENVWISHPAGEEGNEQVAIITFTFAPADPTNYLKLTFYGNDGGQGINEVTHPWISFNSLSFEGSVAAAEAPAEADTGAGGGDPADIPAPAPEVAAPPAPAAVPAAAPPTADPVSLIILGSVISAAGLVIAKKRK